MEFLLILSALLSALTGALTGARAPETRLHHAVASVETAAAAVPRAISPARVATAGAAIGAFALPDALREGVAFALSLPAPLETVRLLE